MSGTKIFVDSNLWIYHFQGDKSVDTSYLDSLLTREVQLVVNELVLSEVLAGYDFELDDGRIQTITDFFTVSKKVEIQPLSPFTSVVGAYFRNQNGLKLPDALHLATAIQSKCTHFYTNDRRIRSYDELEVIYLGQEPSLS